MKKIFLITLFFLINSFAISPFSLEGVKDVNLKVIDKSKLTTKENLKKIKHDVKYTLEKLGIKTETENFSNFIVKIQGIKTKSNYIMHISMFIVEDTVPARDKNVENMSITYYKDDLFDSDTKEIQLDIYESIINYLLTDFYEQYQEENN